MIIKKAFTAALLTLFVGSTAVSGAEIKAPELKAAPKSGSIMNAPGNFYSDFKTSGTNQNAPVQTFYKVYHDNKNLYVAIKAMEPAVERMVRPKMADDSPDLWRTDYVELNFIHRGDEKRLYKIMVDTNGTVAEASGEDDNTGLSKFAMDFAFASHTKVLSHSVNKDNWTLELAIPLGAFHSGDSGNYLPLNMQISRARRAGVDAEGRKTQELTVSHATSNVSFSEVRSFVPLELANFKGDAFTWQLNDAAFKTYRKDGNIVLEANCSVINCGKRFSFCKVRGVLLDRDGNTGAEAAQATGTQPKKMVAFKLPLTVKKNGEHKLRMELYSSRGDLLCEKFRTVMIDYQSIAINMITPWYRDNIYASMPKIDKIEAEILLEENIGKPLEVTLTGPNNFAKTLTLPQAQKVNKIAFDFKDMPDGDYYLKAGSAVKRIRKLPFRTGEVWLDRQGILRREGKKYLPLGVFNIPHNKAEGLNISLFFVSPFRSPAKMKEFLDGCHAAGRPAWIYPYHNFPVPYNYSWAPFTAVDKLKATLNAEQKDILRNYVKLVDNHPGFFGHFLADEPEGRNENPLFLQEVHDVLREADPYHPTLINHYGVEGVAKYKGIADIVGLDCYWDTFKDNNFAWPPDISYRNAKKASEQGKCLVFILQAFDWGHTNRFGGKSRAPTFDEMRAQMYMAFLGNARGIVPFSYTTTGGTFSNHLRIGLLHLMKEPAAMTDVLLEKSDMAAVKAPKGIIAGVKRFGDTFVVIAVNATYNTVDAKIQANFTLPSEMKVASEKRSVKTANNVISDQFGPMATHIYIAGNIPSDAADIAAINAEIKAADDARFKKGNLAAAGELSRAEIYDYKNGIIPAGIPKATASSSVNRMQEAACAYLLQDGLCETIAPPAWNVWTPRSDDRQPWIQYDFGKKVKFSKVTVWSTIAKDGEKSPVIAAEVQIIKGGKWITIAKIDNNTQPTFTIPFPTEEADKVRLLITKTRKLPALSEVEVFE